jgi:putative FmdB family regulatory protein
MPTYEYACKACGEHLEVVQSFRDEPLVTCPACGGHLRKVFGNIGIVFKGSGFYQTDNRSVGKRTSEAPKGPASEGSAADSKPKTSEGAASRPGSDSSSSSSATPPKEAKSA